MSSFSKEIKGYLQTDPKNYWYNFFPLPGRHVFLMFLSSSKLRLEIASYLRLRYQGKFIVTVYYVHKVWIGTKIKPGRDKQPLASRFIPEKNYGRTHTVQPRIANTATAARSTYMHKIQSTSVLQSLNKLNITIVYNDELKISYYYNNSLSLAHHYNSNIICFIVLI